MSYFIGLASVFMSLFVTLTLYPLENNTIMTICMIALPILFMVMLAFAGSVEEKLELRIKALEDKVENNAEHIHKLSKKQSDKTIEYSID